jgi:hypothetical protein
VRRNTNAYRAGMARRLAPPRQRLVAPPPATILWCIAAKMHADRAAANSGEKCRADPGATPIFPVGGFAAAVNQGHPFRGNPGG